MPSTTRELPVPNEAVVDDSPTMASYSAMYARTPVSSRTYVHTPGARARVRQMVSPEDISFRTISSYTPLPRTELLMVTQYVTRKWLPWWQQEQAVKKHSPKLRNMHASPRPAFYCSCFPGYTTFTWDPRIGRLKTEFNMSSDQPDTITIQVSWTKYSGRRERRLTCTDTTAYLRGYCSRILSLLQDAEKLSWCFPCGLSISKLESICSQSKWDVSEYFWWPSLFLDPFEEPPHPLGCQRVFLDFLSRRRLNPMAGSPAIFGLCVTGPHDGLASLRRRYLKNKRAWWRSSQRLTD
jgi:hypothetical protein